jgi:hypothetical protein
MFQKLFNIAVVVFLVIVSFAVLAFLFRGLISTFSTPKITESNGKTAVAGGVSEKWLRLVFLLTVLVGSGYLYLRGRRKPR